TNDAFASSFTDLAIQDSHLGAAPNPLGVSFAGNGGDGFDAQSSTFTGVAFLDSFFNDNGIGKNGGSGIAFISSSINPGTVTLHDPSMMLLTGFKLQGSQAVGNATDGVLFGGVMATDVTIKSTDIAANGVGVFVVASNVSDFVIQDAHLGEVLEAMGNQIFAGNVGEGFMGASSTFTGVAFID